MVPSVGLATTRRTRPSRVTAMETQPAFPIKRTVKGEACVVVIYGPDLGRRVTVARNAFEMGRSSRCDLQIDQESVSRHHARVTFAGGVHLIEDLGSTNGTYVADRKIAGRTELKHGDQIKVGLSILKYMAGDDLETNYHEEIYRLMTVDALTQAFNKRYFGEALEREHNRSKRYARELSLVAFDIDHFKAVNDTHGHVAGDKVLAQLALAIKSRLREQDIFARTGGEEFAVLLPEVPLAGARVTAEKVRAIAEATPLDLGGLVIRCTVSLGVATLGGAIVTGEQLVAEADARLYDAKRGGRNRVGG
jgi:two-component system, cell cycle response regulator